MQYVLFQGDFIKQLLGGDAGHQPVAVLEAAGLQEAFELSNSHGEDSWEGHGGVHVLKSGLRSTSMGDLLVSETLQVHEVLAVGFQQHQGLSRIEAQAAEVLAGLTVRS